MALKGLLKKRTIYYLNTTESMHLFLSLIGNLSLAKNKSYFKSGLENSS